MLILTIIGLGLLTALNFRTAKATVFPPVLFCGLWTVLLFGLFMCGDTFYPVSPTTLLVYFCGATSFSVGGLVAYRRTRVTGSPARLSPRGKMFLSRILNGGLILLLVLLPAYLNYVESLSAESGINSFWKGVRVQSILQSEAARISPGTQVEGLFFGNLVTLSIILGLIAYYEARRTKHNMFRAGTYLAVGMFYVLLTAANAGAAALLLGVLGIDTLLSRRLRIRVLTLYLSLFLCFFWTVGFILEKGQVRSTSSITDNVPALLDLVQLYGLGGLIAFDRVVQDPRAIQATWGIDRFFRQTANKLGASFDLPSLHAEFTMISPTMATNVYTIYFAYFPDYGWLGMFIIMFFLGAVLTWLYVAGSRGSEAAAVLYGVTFGGIMLSGFSESFFIGLNMLVKTMVVTVLIYKVAGMFSKGRDYGVVPFASGGRLYRRA